MLTRLKHKAKKKKVNIRQAFYILYEMEVITFQPTKTTVFISTLNCILEAAYHISLSKQRRGCKENSLNNICLNYL